MWYCPQNTFCIRRFPTPLISRSAAFQISDQNTFYHNIYNRNAHTIPHSIDWSLFRSLLMLDENDRKSKDDLLPHRNSQLSHHISFTRVSHGYSGNFCLPRYPSNFCLPGVSPGTRVPGYPNTGAKTIAQLHIKEASIKKKSMPIW